MGLTILDTYHSNYIITCLHLGITKYSYAKLLKEPTIVSMLPL